MSSKDILPKSGSSTYKIELGMDTETYYEDNQKGLKSIQIYGDKGIRLYITADSYELPDQMIRLNIVNKFWRFLESLTQDAEIAFFNMNFDVSQFLYYMVNQTGCQVLHPEDMKDAHFNIPKNSIYILESNVKMYQVMIRTKTHGRLIRMLDLYNFLPGSNLDESAEAFLGEQKIKVEDKKFPKCAPTETEKVYGMKDAEITYKLLLKLREIHLVEGQRGVSIAGRTMSNFIQFLKDEYNLSFDEYAFRTTNKDEVAEMTRVFESELRPLVRGGITACFQKGYFHDCQHDDKRSMYPTQCVRPFIPLGPMLDEEPDELHTSIVYPSGFFSVKSNKLPYFQWRRKSQTARYYWQTEYEPGEYVNDCYLDGSYGLWEDEWEIVKECYDIQDLEIVKTRYFRLYENGPLKVFVDRLYEGKKNNTGPVRLMYKYLLNALYGKFLSNPEGEGIKYENGKRIVVQELDRKTYYLPLGSWIAAMGRVTLMHAMLSIPKENLIYCDTDSMIYKKGVTPKISYGKELSDWGIEHESVDMWAVGPKTYQELDLLEKDPKKQLITKCAGMPRSDIKDVPWKGLHEGLEIKTRKPKRDTVTWAINFEETTYKISTRAQIFRGH